MTRWGRWSAGAGGEGKEGDLPIPVRFGIHDDIQHAGTPVGYDEFRGYAVIPPTPSGGET